LVVIALFGLVIGRLAHAQQNDVTITPLVEAWRRGAGQEQGTATLRGRVTSRDSGRPLQGAEVAIIGPFGPKEIIGPPRLKSTTDTNGRFVFEQLREGQYGVTVTSPGYVTTSVGQTIWDDATRTLEVPDGQVVTANFALFQGGAISGRLVDASGEPIADARVEALGVLPIRRTRSPIGSGRSFPTNDIGEFRIAELLPGDYYVFARFNQAQPLSRPGLRYVSTFYPGTPNVVGAKKVTVLPGRTHKGIVVTVPRIHAARISGTALDSHGQPLKGALEVVARDRLQEQWASVASSQIQPNGSFTVGGLTAGEYTLLVVAESSAAGAREYVSLNITVADTDLVGLRIVSQTGPTIAGRLIFPASGPGSLNPRAVTVSIQTAEVPEARTVTTYTTLRGDWSFHVTAAPGRKRVSVFGLPASWRLIAVRYRGIDVTDSGFEAQPGTQLDDIELQLADHQSSVSGVVADQLGHPMNRAWAVLFPRERDKWGCVDNVRFVTTGENGRFTFGGLPDGDYVTAAMTALPHKAAIEPTFLSMIESHAQRFSLGTGEAKTLRIPLTLIEDTWRRPPGKWRFLRYLFDWIGHTQFARTGEWAPTTRP